MKLSLSTLVVAAVLSLAISKTAQADSKTDHNDASADNEPAATPPAPSPSAATSSPAALAAPAAPAAMKTRWYGEQILAVDGIALGLLIVGAGTHPAVGVTGAAMYGLGGPIVHLAHDQPYHAAGSLGLRIGAPLAGGALGLGAGLLLSDGSYNSVFVVAGTTLLGFAAGYVAAVTVDAAALAREPVALEPTKRAAKRNATRPSIAPAVDPRADRLTLGVVG